VIAVIGIAAGAAASYALAGLSASWFGAVQLPGVVPVLGASVVLVGAAIAASLIPASRASRVDAMEALRSE
jgi:putative ABC transport system permease protein